MSGDPRRLGAARGSAEYPLRPAHVPRHQDHVRELARRREVLVARSARLRDELADDVGAIGRQVGLVDRGVSAARSGMVLPLAVAGAAVLLFGHPRRVLRITRTALAVWPVARVLLPRVVAFVGAARAGSAEPATPATPGTPADTR